MEQKRTLWIIAAAGVFLLVVVGAALILYSPSLHRSKSQIAFNPNDGWVTNAPSSQTTAPVRSEIPVNPFEKQEAVPNGMQNVPDFSGDVPAAVEGIPQTQYQTSPYAGTGYAPSRQTIQSENVTVVADNATVVGTGTTTIDLNALKGTASSVSAQNTATAAQIEQSRAAVTAPVQEKRYNYEDSTASAKVSSTPASTTVKKSETKKTSAASESASSAKNTATAKAPAKAAPKAAKPADKFWVQVASYANKKSADDAREILESSKLPCEVLTYTDSKGKLFYRVRVGSYTTESEAKYWMTRIKAIDQFAKSGCYVVNSSAKAVK